jgi:hypothetical protein
MIDGILPNLNAVLLLVREKLHLMEFGRGSRYISPPCVSARQQLGLWLRSGFVCVKRHVCVSLLYGQSVWWLHGF